MSPSTFVPAAVLPRLYSHGIITDPSPTGWFVSGILLGPLGVLLALIFAKPKATAMPAVPAAPAAAVASVIAHPVLPPPVGARSTGQPFQCPHCSRPIPGDAAFCPSCGGRLTMSGPSFSGATGIAQSQSVPIAAPASVGSKVALVIVLVVVALGVGAAYLYVKGGIGSLGVSTIPASADLPPAGSIWFGSSFDTTTFHVNGQRTTFKVGDPLALVAHLTKTVGPGEANLRLVVDGIQIANHSINASGGASDVIGVTYATPFNGTYAFTITDVGGNVLASGTISVLPQ